MSFVFVSYPRAIKPDVELFVKKLTASNLEVFWDDDLHPGEWETQLQQKLQGAAVMVVFVNSEVVDRGNDSYVLKEVKIAVDQGVDVILPIELGKINISGDIRPLLEKYQMMRVESFQELMSSNELQRHLTYFKDYIDNGGRKTHPNRSTTVGQTTSGWPLEGDDLLEKQALALAIALFEGELPSLVSDAAASIQSALAEHLRDETPEERDQKPRAFTAPAFSDRLRSIGAEQISVTAGYLAAQDIVRFKDPNQRRRLLKYLWKEQPAVRGIIVSWIKLVLTGELSPALMKRISNGLSHIAQIDLAGVSYEFLNAWFSIDLANGKETLVESDLDMASSLLASAYNVRGNRDLIRKLVNDLAQCRTLPPNYRFVAEEAAFVVLLGALGQRAPSLPVELFRTNGRSLQIGRRWNPSLCKRVLRSALVWGEDVRDEITFAQYDAHAETSQPSTEATSLEIETPSLSDHDPEAPEYETDTLSNEPIVAETPDPEPEQTDATEQTISNRSEQRASRGLPTADFLEAMALWIDEPISDPKKLYDRQIAIWVFLSVFERMPVYSTPSIHRLTLEDLLDVIGEKEPALVDALVAAFVRAARARPQASSRYLAFRHLETVLRFFAQKREQDDARCETHQDPLLRFARRIYEDAEKAEAGCGSYVTRGTARFLSPEELDFIEGKTDLVVGKESL